MNDQLLSSTEFRERLGNISTSTLYRLVKMGAIPKPIKLGENSGNNYYRDSWVDDLINSKELNNDTDI